jgi:flagellar hook-associated protein 1 FlgK
VGFLLGSLQSAARALEAQSYGLEITGQNIANVNTAGYTRRSVTFAETVAYPGVDIEGVTAARTPLIDARLWHEQPAASQQGAIADNLAVVESSLGTVGSSLDKNLADFYSAFSSLAQNPTSSTARSQVVAAGQTLASAFNSMSGRISKAQADADVQVRSAVDQVNTLAARIASLNTQLSGAEPATSAALRDQMGDSLSALSQLIDFSTITHDDGSVDVAIGNGHALVSADNVTKLTMSSAPPQGFAAIASGGTDVTADISGGSLGGVLRVRDTLVPGYLNQLDQLASGVVSTVNAAHQAGFDLNGTAGVPFFTPLASVAGAAKNMSVNSAIVADPRLVAAAGTTSAGDNQAARAIANLQDAALPGGTASPLAAWGAMVSQVGSDIRTAQQEQTSRDDVVRQLQNLRDQTSGVSLDEEAAAMMKFQRAYEANARFFNVVNETFDMLTTMVAQ